MTHIPFVSAPQVGPGHRTVHVKCGRGSISIRCDDNEEALEMSKSLIGLFTRMRKEGTTKRRRAAAEARMAEQEEHSQG